MKVEIGVIEPQAKECLLPLETEIGREQILHRASGGSVAMSRF